MDKNQFNMQNVMMMMMNNPLLYNLFQQQMNQMNAPKKEYIRINPTFIEKIKTNMNELESHLFTFFCMILMDSEKAKYFMWIIMI